MPTEHPTTPGILPGLLLGVILFGLFVPGSHPSSGGLFIPPWDKLAHFTIFAILAASIQARWPRLLPLWVIALAVLVGITDELHQLLVPGRQADWSDGLADLLGSISGLLAWRGAQKLRQR